MESLKLFLVVLHHERRLGEHLAGPGEHGGDLRAVGHGFEHGFLGVTLHTHGQIVLVAGVLIGKHHGTRDERTVGGGQFGFVHASQCVAHGLRAELQTCRGCNGDGTGLSFRIHRVNTADGQRCALLCRIKLIVIRDDERITAPDLVL